MTKYIIRRLLWGIPVLFFVILVVFILVRFLPGGPFDFAGEKQLPPAVVKNLEAKYHLNDPLWKQFVDYLWGVVRGDLGPSFRYRNRTVNDVIAEGLPVSAQLGMLAMLIAIGIGIPLGIIAALRHNTIVDYLATFFAIVGVSIPAIVMGPLLIWIFALKLQWFPVSRWGAQPPYFLGFLPKPDLTFWRHAILPAFTLGTGLSASIARLTRASLLQVIREDYIRTARAKGLAERMVIFRHALKNSMIPVVTILGPMFAAVLTGTFVVEQIFAIPGLGKHFVTSIGNRDYPIIMGTTLLYGVAIVIANLLVDIVYAWLDPRIRFD
ncbi:MAG: ABC transporter permease [Anaerolineae bacterium]|nr:ABC transporter permease [Anaerolineae bacterium]